MSDESNPAAPRLQRSDYKAVWSDLSDTLARAKMHVIGTEDEDALTGSGKATADFLSRRVGIRPEDTVLEIGCGIGRVGKQLAPRCHKWIGCDVSPNMVKLARERLQEFSNVELFETSGHDLKSIADLSIDVAYCTVVFMHLDPWDRFSLVKEAFRVLRPGGRIYVDNANLCSDEGWAVFEHHQHYPPHDRPAHMTECSTPQELQEYLKRAGFAEIETGLDGLFVAVWGKKPTAES
jgi:ubiquinone/menaquinone biosynthesis C-methylase UbiE